MDRLYNTFVDDQTTGPGFYLHIRGYRLRIQKNRGRTYFKVIISYLC